MGLLGFFAKPKNTVNEDLNHLTPNGDLPWGWHTENKEYIEKLQAQYTFFLSKWLSSMDKSPREQLNALSSFVRYMNDVKKACESKGECFSYWRVELFTDEYLASRTKELERLRGNITILSQKYEADQQIQAEIVPNLEKQLCSAIRKNPGILQTDVYGMYESNVKPYISEALYVMEKNGIIIRTKRGRTYELRIK